jgi:WD40 repeat protein
MRASRKLAIITALSAFVCSTVAGAPPRPIWQMKAAKAIALSADAQLMLSGIQVRSTASGSLIRTFTTGYTNTGVNAGAFSPDGKLAALGIQAFNRNLFLFRVADGVKLAGPISAHNNGTTSVAFSPAGPLLASGGIDGTVKLWRLPDMTLLRTLNGGVGYRPRVFAVLFSKDGSTLAVASQGGVLQFRVSDGVMLRQLTNVASLSLALSANGLVLASGSNRMDQYSQCVDCTIKLWRMADGAPSGTIPGNNNGVKSLAFSPDQQVLAVGAGDRAYNGSVRFISMKTGKALDVWLQDPNNLGSYVTTVVYAPFGRTFMYAREDGLVTASLGF